MPTFPTLAYVCPIPWDSMRGDERERYCSKCSRHVANISLLTEEQRAALLAQAKPGGLCVAYYRRLSGECVSAETPLKPAESRAVVQFGVAALTMGVAAFAVANLPDEVQQNIAAKAGNVTAQVAAQTRDAINSVAVRLGIKKQPPPVTMFMGEPMCLPPRVATTPLAASASDPAPQPSP